MAIPQEADDAFQKNAVFRKQISNLENIKAQYNNIILLLNDVERPMVQNKLNKVEQQLKPGLESITWENSAEIDKFTKSCHKIISELADTVTKLKTFVGKIDSIFKEISEMKPLENGFVFFDKGKKIKDSFSLWASEKENYIIASTDPYLNNQDLTGKTLDNIPWYNKNLISRTYFSYQNRLFVPFVKYIDNNTVLIICVPKSEMFKEINKLRAGPILINKVGLYLNFAFLEYAEAHFANSLFSEPDNLIF